MTFASTYPDHLQYLQRGYEAAMAATQFDAVVLCSGTAASKNRFDDQTWSLSPTPAFAHWCPLVQADAYVVVRSGKPPQLVRVISDDFWETTALPESDHFLVGFELVMTKPDKLHDVLPASNVRVAVVTRDPGKSPPGEVNPAALIAAIDRVRTTKTAYEIACLVEAEKRAILGHRATEAMFLGGTPSELDLHLAYLAASEQDDPACPYKNIVALGAHAAVLHYVAYTRERVTGDTSLLVDAGAKCNGYGSDITRTYVRGTSPGAQRFRELLGALEKLQLAVCSKIAAGLPYEELHDESHRLLGAVLVETGIGGRGASAAELVDRGVTRALFPHGLGHSLGITVHDVGMKLTPPRADNPFLRNTSTIAVGQVFTVEPGIYMIDALLAPLQADARRALVDWAAIDELRPFGGIRIEDNVLVTTDGIRNLTREAYACGS